MSSTFAVRLVGLLILALCATSCAAYGSELSDQELYAQGRAELERIGTTVHADEIAIPAWTTSGERQDTAAHPNNNSAELFGNIGRTPTSMRWTYVLEPGVDVNNALDAAVVELEKVGASLESERTAVRSLSVTTEFDQLSIRLKLLDSGEIAHSVVRVGDA